MISNTRAWRILVTPAVCLLATTSASAVSGRQLAIARAFQYTYNNPMPTIGSGPLGSSIYSGDSSAPRPGVAPPPPGFAAMNTPISGALRETQPYVPLTPVTVGPSGAMPALSAPQGPYSANPIRDMASVLQGQDKIGSTLAGQWLTSLAPAAPGAYRSAMLRGESDFRRGQYDQALNSFVAARELSKDSPESLLSLFHAYLAIGGKSYGQAAECLAGALKAFPDLASVRVRPADFFGDANSFAACRAALDKFAQDNAADAGALLMVGYMQWRDGLIDRSLRTLDAAMAASPGALVSAGVASMLEGISRSAQLVLSAAPAMSQPADYPWAGIRLAVPKGFAPSPLESLSQVLVGTVQDADGGESYPVNLYAYPLDESMKLDAFMDFLTGAMRQWPFVKDLTREADLEVALLGEKALVRTMTYANSAKGGKTGMAWVAFIRQPKDATGVRIGYVLGVLMSEKNADKLLPTLAAMARSIAMIPPAPTPPGALDVQSCIVEDSQFGFAIAQPWGWASKQTDKGYEIGQMDFATGAVSPKVEVIVLTIEGSYTPRTFGEQAAGRRLRQGMVRKIISQGPVRFAGQDGYQFVAAQSPDANSLASGAAPAPPSTLVARLACLDRPDGKKTLYALVVQCPQGDDKTALALADRFSSSFAIRPPQQPAPAPAANAK